MTPPVDLMEIAAQRLYAASEWVRAVMAMNASPSAELAYQNAVVAETAAERDMAAVRRYAETLMGIRP